MSLSGPKSPRATEPNTRTLLAPRPATVSRIFALFSFKIPSRFIPDPRVLQRCLQIAYIRLATEDGKERKGLKSNGGAEGDRTPDLMTASELDPGGGAGVADSGAEVREVLAVSVERGEGLAGF